MLKPGQHNSLVSLIVEDGAHHYDLRGEHPADTESVREVAHQTLDCGGARAAARAKAHGARAHFACRVCIMTLTKR
uniref:Uncharacterized protein n=1 Tax=Globodera rostochiensis TaxID=31243 RepID=A0A914GW70_GLORO